MTRNRLIGLCAVVAFVTFASKSTVRWDNLPDVTPLEDIQMSDDPETVRFVNVYLGHGWQFDPE
jgi:hypothetical protein